MQDSELNNYLKPQEWTLNKVYFDYEGQRFEGRGVLRWDVTKGFSLEAPLHEKLKKSVQFRTKLITKGDRSSIRMHLKGGGVAVAPSVPLVNRYDIVSENRISISLRKVVFLNHYDFPVGEGEYWIGKAIYEYDSQKIGRLLDLVEIKQEITIQDYSFESHSSHFKGIYREDAQNSRVILYASNDKYIHCDWKIHKGVLTKADSTRFARAIQYALSILTGESVCLLHYELFYGFQRRREIRKCNPHTSLDYLRLLPENIKDRTMLKEFFYTLSIALAKQTRESLICKNILFQTSEAASQSNWYVQELLVATILEATLRNIDNQPFQQKKGKSKNEWNVGSSLNNFLNRYFSSRCDTSQLKSKIMQAHSFLRDRNAHPDWLFTQGGSLSEEEMEKSFDSMNFLIHFYGYVILALLGFNNVQLRFPKPISQWGANLIITPSLLDI
jgi:hypothetical protein